MDISGNIGDEDDIRREYREHIEKALNLNREFSISFERFQELRNSQCRYCGMTSAKQDPPMLLDRFSKRGGYTMRNTVSACEDCHRMKNVFPSVNKYIAHLNKIIEYQKLKVHMKVASSS